MIVLGIDNGLDGGVFAIRLETKVSMKFVTPTLGVGKRSYDLGAMAAIVEGLVRGESSHAFIERAQAMPGQGVSSMFSIGLGYGMWQGILAGLQIPFEVVSPQRWQKEMFVGVNKADTKAASATVAQRLRPDVDWRASTRCRKPHDGLTDAFCIAEYGVRELAKRSHKAAV
jgi:crossover junction endodeoxyribonuclease RuvC